MDWGTSNVRVMRLAVGGRVLEERADPRGAGELTSDAFAGVLEEVAGDWLAEAPVLICGMAGAKGRWLEAPYAPCPASLTDLAAALVRPDPKREVFIVPGVAEMGPGGLSDVMRGEETQMMGLMDAGVDGWAIAPGTHSKWVRLEIGRIAAFRTFATGELYAAVQEGTILTGGGTDTRPDDAAFRRGVERGLAEPALSAALFSVRVGFLAGRLTPETAPDYLSGLLIGAEIAAQADEARGQALALIGAAALTRRYARAMEIAGLGHADIHDAAEVTARGLWRIWEART
ncbi:2-dehydro-3-deoxygalactonokinase [Brevundimonas alba]